MIKSFNEFIIENNYTSPIINAKPQRSVCFTKTAFDQFNEWLTIDRKQYKSVRKLIEQTMRDPFGGSKVEPLVGDKSGKWSKRIDDKNRLVYTVSEDMIKIFSCLGHYDDK